MDALMIYPKRGRMFMLAFVSFVFVLLGILFLWISFDEGSPFWLGLIGIIVIAFFGLGAVYYVIELLNWRPALIVSDEGIVDRSSFVGAGLIKWEEIESMEFISMSGQVFLSIFTYDPNLIIDRTSGIKRVLNKLNKGLLPSQANIPVKNLAHSIDDLMEEISSRWELRIADADVSAEEA